MIVGYTNLDSLTWNLPEASHTKMVDKVIQEIETLGFHDSLLDQVWMNCPGRQIYVKNIVRAFSDHNLVITSYRTKEVLADSHDSIMRYRNQWDAAAAYSLEIEKIGWTEMLSSDDLDFINNTLEAEILNILNKSHGGSFTEYVILFLNIMEVKGMLAPLF